jgi:hypothetical protein
MEMERPVKGNLTLVKIAVSGYDRQPQRLVTVSAASGGKTGGARWDRDALEGTV